MFTKRSPEGLPHVGIIGSAQAAAGSTTSDAVQLAAAGVVSVTGADATKGAKLWSTTAPRNVGDTFILRNVTAAVLKVYPYTGGTINGGSVDAATSIAASAFAVFVCTAANTWLAFEAPAA